MIPKKTYAIAGIMTSLAGLVFIKFSQDVEILGLDFFGMDIV